MGTYNFTNMATFKNWSAFVVFVDTTWGGLLTGSSTAMGIFLSKKLFLN
jgi:Predicted membrane protein